MATSIDKYRVLLPKSVPVSRRDDSLSEIEDQWTEPDAPLEAFTFINTSSIPAARQNSTQKLIKSHARKWAHRDRLSKTTVQSRTLIPRTTAVLNAIQSKKRSTTLSRSTTRPFSSPEPSRPLDKYGPLPFKISISQHSLIEIYFHVMGPLTWVLDKAMQVNPFLTWIPMIMSDEVAMMANLWSAAIFKSMMLGSGNTIECAVMLRRALAQLNDRLKTANALTEPTVSAVASFLGMEMFMGNFENWSIHRQGLATMIKARGGLKTLDPALQCKAYLGDLQGAVRWLTVPLLELPERTNDLPAGMSATEYDSFTHYLNQTTLRPELRRVFMEIRQFSRAIGEALRNEEKKIHPHTFEQECFHIDNTLLSLQENTLTPLERCCQLSGLIYIHTLATPLPMYGDHLTVALTALRTSLDAIERNAADDADIYPRSLLIWLYAMGALSTFGRLEHQWFLSGVANNLNYTNAYDSAWAAVNSAVAEVLWIDVVHDTHLKQYWEHFEISRSTVASGMRVDMDHNSRARLAPFPDVEIASEIDT